MRVFSKWVMDTAAVAVNVVGIVAIGAVLFTLLRIIEGLTGIPLSQIGSLGG